MALATRQGTGTHRSPPEVLIHTSVPRLDHTSWREASLCPVYSGHSIKLTTLTSECMKDERKVTTGRNKAPEPTRSSSERSGLLLGSNLSFCFTLHDADRAVSPSLLPRTPWPGLSQVRDMILQAAQGLSWGPKLQAGGRRPRGPGRYCLASVPFCHKVGSQAVHVPLLSAWQLLWQQPALSLLQTVPWSPDAGGCSDSVNQAYPGHCTGPGALNQMWTQTPESS